MTLFDDWYRRAPVGESYIYHEGYLPRERDVHWTPAKGNNADQAHWRACLAEAARIEAEANAAMQAFDRGEVMLTQIKRGFLQYKYRATKRPESSSA
jgi:hypothetical protein